MNDKYKNYGLWLSVASCIIMVLQACGLKFDVLYVNEIITAIMGLLVVLGIISNPTDGNGFVDKE